VDARGCPADSFLPADGTPARLRIRLTLLSDTCTPSTVTRWSIPPRHTYLTHVEPQEPAVLRQWVMALECPCGRALFVGIVQVQVRRRSLPTARIGRLSFVSWRYVLICFHLSSQRQMVVRWTPQRLATMPSGIRSMRSKPQGGRSRFGRLGLLE